MTQLSPNAKTEDFILFIACSNMFKFTIISSTWKKISLLYQCLVHDVSSIGKLLGSWNIWKSTQSSTFNVFVGEEGFVII